MRMMPGVINEIAGILKKLSLLVFLFLVFAQPVLSQDTWENNKKYIGERLDTLTKEVQALRLDLKCYVDAKATLESTISNQNTKIEAVKEQTDEVQSSLKYLYGLLVLSIGGNAVSGGVLLKNRKNGKQQTTNTEI
jgi:septal ring factor EnvC (AmiA/AmiB activator)